MKKLMLTGLVCAQSLAMLGSDESRGWMQIVKNGTPAVLKLTAFVAGTALFTDMVRRTYFVDNSSGLSAEEASKLQQRIHDLEQAVGNEKKGLTERVLQVSQRVEEIGPQVTSLKKIVIGDNKTSGLRRDIGSCNDRLQHLISIVGATEKEGLRSTVTDVTRLASEHQQRRAQDAEALASLSAVIRNMQQHQAASVATANSSGDSNATTTTTTTTMAGVSPMKVVE